MAANKPDHDDGSAGNAWYRLTPDSNGHYVNGRWSNRASMNDSRLFYSSQVLRDGRVFVAGGEYASNNRSELYDPVQDHWTQNNPPTSLLDPSKGQAFVDSNSKVLPDGTVLVRPVLPNINNGTLIYDPSGPGWSQGPQTVLTLGEESWVKLSDGSILTVDPIRTTGGGVSFNGFGTNSERYIPALKQWFPDANLPASLYATLPGYFGETGPGFLLPNGKAFFLGGSGHTAIYNPSILGGTNAGLWVAGPDLDPGLGSADAPAAMMPNGKILCAVAAAPYVDGSGNLQFPSPTYFYEYDYTDGFVGSFTQVGGPTSQFFDNTSSFRCSMLMLPDGSVLYSDYTDQLYVYVPDGSPLPSWKPTISSVTPNADGSFHLVGTGLTGISAGAAYGDDWQMDTDFPIVRFTNLSDGTGHVDYGRTYNWSTNGVMTGDALVSTEFTLPTGLIPGTYALSVIANGIASDPYTFLSPVWVDFNRGDGTQNGSYSYPFKTLVQGTNAVSPGGSIFIKTAGSSPDPITISKPMTIRAVGGLAKIGGI